MFQALELQIEKKKYLPPDKYKSLIQVYRWGLDNGHTRHQKEDGPQ